ncbi:MAG: hypothetical protein ACYC0J_00755 [Gammaproteobacteria bacterium]
MKINFSKKEYRTLLEMIYISGWILHADAAQQEEYNEAHKALREKILSFYKDMQAEDLIEKSSEDFYETRRFEEYMHEGFISKYDQTRFWENLIDELSKRDVIAKLGIDGFSQLDPLTRGAQLDEAMECYVNEFEQHGLDHVRIVYPGRVKN